MTQKKTYTGHTDIVERSLADFTQMMIEKIESLSGSEKWQQPWFTEGAMQQPVNMSNRAYNGMNSVILMLTAEKNGYHLPVWGTFNTITALNYQKDTKGNVTVRKDDDGNDLPRVTVNKGEHGSNVFITTFTCVNRETGEKIPYEAYKQLTPEEQTKWAVYPRLNVYRVFNIAQTNIKEARPELYAKYEARVKRVKPSEVTGGYRDKAFDRLIETQQWICPINLCEQDRAYYSISKDAITYPLYGQFRDGESFYGSLCHEMAHSTGREGHLNRFKNMEKFNYASEELTAELTSALVMSRRGVEKHLKDDSAVYLKSWLDSLRETPAFIKSVLTDVKNAAVIIEDALSRAETTDFEPQTASES